MTDHQPDPMPNDWLAEPVKPSRQFSRSLRRDLMAELNGAGALQQTASHPSRRPPSRTPILATAVLALALILTGGLLAASRIGGPDRPQATSVAAAAPIAATPSATSATPGTGCVTGTEPGNAVAFHAELTCTAALFPWPDGISLDIDRLAPAGSTNLYQTGGSYAIAASTSACAWYGSWLSATKSGDEADAAAALETIVMVIPNYPALVSGFPIVGVGNEGSGYPEGIISQEQMDHWQATANSAATGDVRAVEEEVALSCPATLPVLVDGTPLAGGSPVPFPASASPCVIAGGPDQMMDAAMFRNELACAATSFPWPAGYGIDVDGVVFSMAATNDGSVLFLPGTGYAEAAAINACAWYGSWIAATESGDLATAGESLDQIITLVPNYESMIPGFPAGRVSVPRGGSWALIASRAADGDTAGINEAWASCTSAGLVTPVPGGG